MPRINRREGGPGPARPRERNRRSPERVAWAAAHVTTRPQATALAAVLGCVVGPGAAVGVGLGFLRVRVRVRVLGLGLANPNPNTLTRP